MLIIIFGEMGMGKNFVGELIAQKLGYTFYDGDKAIRKGVDKLNSPEGVHSFVKNGLIPAVKAQLETYPNLVVSQALYFQKDREAISEEISKDTRFVRVNCAPKNQTQRLLQRNSSENWLQYAAISKPYFEEPPVDNKAFLYIQNDKTKEDVVSQIEVLCKSSKLPRAIKNKAKVHKPSIFQKPDQNAKVDQENILHQAVNFRL